MASRDVGRIKWSETCLTTSRSPRSHCRKQLIVQLGICEEKWPYIRRTARTYHHFSTDKKNSQKNLFGIIFSFEPRRLLPDKHRTQSQSTFFWSHNTNMQAAMNILRDEELIRPSKWQEHPSPNRECSNWNNPGHRVLILINILKLVLILIFFQLQIIDLKAS